jgi:hypothetical protein
MTRVLAFPRFSYNALGIDYLLGELQATQSKRQQCTVIATNGAAILNCGGDAEN